MVKINFKASSMLIFLFFSKLGWFRGSAAKLSLFKILWWLLRELVRDESDAISVNAWMP